MTEAPLTAPPPPPLLTIEQRREILQQEVSRYVSRGFIVVSQTDTTAQLVKKKKFSCLVAVISLLLLMFLLYLIGYWVSRDKTVYLQVDERGQIIGSGAVMRPPRSKEVRPKEARPKADNAWNRASNGQQLLIISGVVIWGMLMCVFFSVVIGSLSSSENPASAAPIDATLAIPTVPFVPSATPEPKPQAPPEVLEYSVIVVRYVASIGTTTSNIGALFGEAADNQLLLFDTTWLGEMQYHIDAVQIAYDTLSAASPPAGMSEIHNLFLDAGETCNLSMTFLGYGLDSLAADDFDKSANLVDICAGKLDTANNALLDYLEQFE